MFWRGVIGYLPANLVQAAVGLLTIVIFTRLLSPEEYGHYALGFTVMTLVHTVVFTWNEAAMARFWAGEEIKGEARDHLSSVYRIWAMLLIALPVAAGLTLIWPMNAGLRWAALAGVAAILPRTLEKLFQERRRAAGEVRGAVALDMGLTGGGFLLGVALAWAGLGGAAPLLGAGAAAAICLLFVLTQEWSRSTGGRLDPERVRRNFAYGAPVALSLVLAIVLSSTDRILIAAFLDEASVGVYHAGYSLANRTLDVVFIWLGAAGGPALIMALERGGPEAMRQAAREQASFMLLLTVPAAVGLAMVARPLAELLVGPELRVGAGQVTPWIAASGFLGGMTTYYFSQAFTLSRRTTLLLVAMSIPAAANVVLNLVLIPQMGLQGALAATVASYGLGLVGYLILGRGPMALPIPWLTLAQTSFASAAMAFVLSRLPSPGGVVELALKASTGAVVYGLITYALDVGGLRSRAAGALRMVRARMAAS
jgi:O-antigen/teichoic acid export membrane protein